MSNAFEKYGINIPQKELKEFVHEDRMKILNFRVGKMVPRVLKEFDKFITKKNELTSKQTSLLYTGKDDKRPNYVMQPYVREYIHFYNSINIELVTAVEDILEEMIRDMLSYDKNQKRKDKFFEMFNSLTGITFVFVIGMICLGEQLIKEKREIKNGRYLEYVLMAKQDLSKEIREIYIKMSKGEITQEEANTLFRNKIEKRFKNW